MSRDVEIQRLQRKYKTDTGITDIDVTAFAAWMVDQGWPLPKPTTAMERLVKQCKAALRNETRTDGDSEEPYRANHMYIVAGEDFNQRHLWFDIDEGDDSEANGQAMRPKLDIALKLRREQGISDFTQMVRDAARFNRRFPSVEALQVELDLKLDVEIRRNTPAEV